MCVYVCIYVCIYVSLAVCAQRPTHYHSIQLQSLYCKGLIKEAPSWKHAFLPRGTPTRSAQGKMMSVKPPLIKCTGVPRECSALIRFATPAVNLGGSASMKSCSCWRVGCNRSSRCPRATSNGTEPPIACGANVDGKRCFEWHEVHGA